MIYYDYNQRYIIMISLLTSIFTYIYIYHYIAVWVYTIFSPMITIYSIYIIIIILPKLVLMGFARYYGCTIIKITPTQPETWLNAGIPTMDMPSVWFSISINQCIGYISILATHLVENMGMLPRYDYRICSLTSLYEQCWHMLTGVDQK